MTSRITPYTPNAVRIMITDGGPHPADFWAQVTAEHIAPIKEDMTGARHAAALRLQAKIAEALEPHHARVQENEKAKCTNDAAHHLLAVEPEVHAGADANLAIADIVAAAAGTEWEAHFKDAAVQAEIREEVKRHFATAQHIERSWHADRLAGRT